VAEMAYTGMMPVSSKRNNVFITWNVRGDGK